MKHQIQNMKCAGCTTRIKERLSSIEGISNVNTDLEDNSITFLYETTAALSNVKTTLKKMGYPLSDEENTIGDISKSYVNCMIGKVKNAF